MNLRTPTLMLVLLATCYLLLVGLHPAVYKVRREPFKRLAVRDVRAGRTEFDEAAQAVIRGGKRGTEGGPQLLHGRGFRVGHQGLGIVQSLLRCLEMSRQLREPRVDLADFREVLLQSRADLSVTGAAGGFGFRALGLLLGLLGLRDG